MDIHAKRIENNRGHTKNKDNSRSNWKKTTYIFVIRQSSSGKVSVITASCELRHV